MNTNRPFTIPTIKNAFVGVLLTGVMLLAGGYSMIAVTQESASLDRCAELPATGIQRGDYPRTAILACRELIEANEHQPEASYYLARHFFFLGDLDDAQKALTGAANAGHTQSKVALMFFNEQLEDNPQGLLFGAATLRALRDAADEGNTSAMLLIGMHLNNALTPNDGPEQEQAIAFFRQAQQHGDPVGSLYLATHYLHDDTDDSSRAKAIVLLQSAAEGGVGAAAELLAELGELPPLTEPVEDTRYRFGDPRSFLLNRP